MKSFRSPDIRVLGSWAILVLIVIQFIPLDRSNPDSSNLPELPDNTLGILKRSCLDCHSNITRWPRTAWVAPASWFISSSVDKGRQALNFSHWEEYSPDERLKLLSDMKPVIRLQKPHAVLYRAVNGESVPGPLQQRELLRWADSELDAASKTRVKGTGSEIQRIPSLME
ncbi:heme-binding domain-containing protein [Prosthecochloris sp. HL-130-GSB]|jgi:hypothetical protein|uniref:Haem-binding domain-containing protein n=1 Tax=Prosthecochloris aestuarii TaxID=1102 RepID=A0A831SUN3_PROAE|nr:heme-binding domain-containing protein [Prosthecochloris sp. HL-130-GSB]ARM31457.1 hypothetical protein B9H02_09290 [Prosthecochloris sp. HL-130-GSB]MBO8092880.1 heme-binding domain-containing protein [Prosthecochloris sp.]HED31820.1 hypothetical protein [Prosthecochloris aestuarii]